MLFRQNQPICPPPVVCCLVRLGSRNENWPVRVCSRTCACAVIGEHVAVILLRFKRLPPWHLELKRGLENRQQASGRTCGDASLRMAH